MANSIFIRPNESTGYFGSIIQGGALNLITTSTDGILSANNSLSTAAVPVQQSPRIRLRSNVWNTTATAANNTNDWIVESVPVSGANPSGLLKFGSSLNGGATTFPFEIQSGGLVRSLSGFNTFNGNFTVNSSGQLFALQISATNLLISNGPIRSKGYTVSTLPASPIQGDLAFVTDALAPTFLATVVGGGAVVTPVFYNGTNWVGV